MKGFGKSKYGARKTVFDGITFDSKHEAEVYAELLILQRDGLCHNIRRQVPYELIPTEKGPDGKTERKVVYKADFVYLDDMDRVHVADAKGFRTPVYILKKRLMWHKYKINIEEW